MKKILGSIALAGLPLLFAVGAFTPAVASAHTGFNIVWHHICNWHPKFGHSDGTVVVIKRTIDGNGTFQMSGNGVGSFSITTHRHFGVKTLRHVDPGTLTITETVPAGWTQVSNTCTNINVRAHRTSFCLIVNKKGGTPDTDPTPSQTGSLKVNKVTVGGDGTFSFTHAGGTFQITTVNGSNSETLTNIPVGSYSVSEDDPTSAGWSITDNANNAPSCDEVTIVAGQTAECTITNSKIQQTGTLVIQKMAAGGTGSFSFNLTDSNNVAVAIYPIQVPTENQAGEETVTDMPVGMFTLTEVTQSGWTNGEISCVDENGNSSHTIVAGKSVTCSVINTKTQSTPTNQSTVNGGGGGGGGGGNTGNGPPVGGGGGGGTGTWTFNFPQVLGASSTTLPDLPKGCSALLSSYMRKGKPNNVAEVKKLQEFLNKELNLNLPITGFFGPLTDKGVRQFQLIHKPQVLTPWGITDPTGYVYKTTLRWINLSACASLDIPMPELN